MKQNNTKAALNLAVRSIHRILILFVVFGILTASTGCHKQSTAKMQPLVNAKWLNEHLKDYDLLVLDTTVLVDFDNKGNVSITSGRDKYNTEHIPGAGFADLMGSLSATDTEMKFIMPTAQQFQNAMSKLGVADNTRIILYTSATNQSWPERLWWMLRWVGFDQVAILDGGLRAWKDEGLPLSTKTIKPVKKSFTVTLRPEIIAYRDEVFAAIEDNHVQIIDALPATHYQGKFSMYARVGHIPNAINIPTSNLFDEFGYYKPIKELETMFKTDQNNRLITYCGGGVSASSTAFTLHRLGYKDVAVYMGSLQEWTVNNENPMSVEN